MKHSRLHFAVLFTSFVTLAFGQVPAGPTSGSISGVVVGDDGTIIPNARVYAARTSSAAKLKAPPTVVASVAQTAYADRTGAFSVAGLLPGLYVLCAETNIAGWLDPCHWSSAMSPVSVTAGHTLTLQRIVLQKGSILTVRIGDPTKLLPAPATAVVHDVEVLVRASNNLYYQSTVTAYDSTSRTHTVTLPFNASHTLIVRSQQFSLSDSKGAAVPASGHFEAVQTSSAAPAESAVLSVTGKAY